MLIKEISDIKKRMNEIVFHENFDLIVAIARGGIVPAAMLQARLGCDMDLLWLNFRDETQTPVRDEPLLLKELSFDPSGKTILLVDDRSRSGKTFLKAKSILADAKAVKTCAVNGGSDYSLFNEDCFYFPWRMDV